MRRKQLLSTAGVCLLQAAVLCVLIAAASTRVGAQTQSTPTPQPTQAAANADEDFELNIEERRISEPDFHAETAVETDGTRGLHVAVGVALRASDIDVLLRNVRGHVRFRASLAPVLRLLEARRVAPTQTPPP